MLTIASQQKSFWETNNFLLPVVIYMQLKSIVQTLFDFWIIKEYRSSQKDKKVVLKIINQRSKRKKLFRHQYLLLLNKSSLK